MGRKLRNRIKRLLLAVHRLGLRLGVVILPNHYYISIPDLNALARTQNVWARRSELRGIDADVDGQARRLVEICGPFEPEYRGNRAYLDACARGAGPGYGYIEAQALHGVVRHLRPRTIIEVGAGVSTACILDAVARNEREGAERCEVISIEPYPRPWLRGAPVRLIERAVQEVERELFDGLGARDLLFIDSSHAVKVGSDVNHLILEVLPRLRRGVIVHLHDIYLPYDFPRDALATLSQPQETALLHAYLIGNPNVRIVFSLSMLHYERRDVLKQGFPEYSPQRERGGLQDPSYRAFDEIAGHFPSSIYLEILGPATRDGE